MLQFSVADLEGLLRVAVERTSVGLVKASSLKKEVQAALEGK